jgi:hypothetical protein
MAQSSHVTAAVPLEVQPRGVSFPTGAAVGRTDATVVTLVTLVAAPAREGRAPVSSATTPTTDAIRRRARAWRRVAGERVAEGLVAGL